MAERTSSRRGGFTLVEMLVVIAIIAILAAILIPAGGAAIRTARRAANAFEMAQVDEAIARYASENGGINPPSFGEAQAMGTTYTAIFNNGTGPWQNTLLGRYVRKAYPKCSQRDIQYMFTQVADKMDQSSALPFWLASTSGDARYPFTGPTKRTYLTMEEQRLTPLNAVPGNAAAKPPIPDLTLYGFRPKHAGESFYVYIEAGHYRLHVKDDLSLNQAGGRPAAGNGASPETTVRPWLRQQVVNSSCLEPRNYINGETYQLHCAGLDGRFSVNHDWLRKWPGGSTGLKFNGSQQDPGEFIDDRDNQTNFSDGGTVTDAPAQ